MFQLRTPALSRSILLVGYLLTAAVALRSVDYFRQSGQAGRMAMALLGLYAVVLTLEQWLHPRFNGQLYLALQTAVVSAAMLLAREQDYYACLFFPLSTQAMLYFPRRAGLAWIVVFSAISMALVAWHQSVTLAIFYGVAGVFFASYGALLAQTVAANRQLA